MESGLYILYKPKFIWSKREASAHQINWRSFKFTVFLSSLRLSKGCFVSVLKMTTFCHFPIPMLTYQTPKHCTEVCNTKRNDFTALDGKHFILTNIMLKLSLWLVSAASWRTMCHRLAANLSLVPFFCLMNISCLFESVLTDWRLGWSRTEQSLIGFN